MMQFQADAKRFSDPERMAAAYLYRYFGNDKIEYPINPFKMLKDEGILFSLSNFRKLEGVYIPASTIDDVATVGINVNRPITRQRFTAAHELCHHFRDADRQISCPIGGQKPQYEKFADRFAGALLMPLHDLQLQVYQRRHGQNPVSFDDVLEIADFFGVSFEACLRRIAYTLHAISGDIDSKALSKRIREYKPDKKRKDRHMTCTGLYADLIDCYQEQLMFVPTNYAKYIFQNNYIYNDSRMEGLDITIDQAAEIVADLRLNMQNSEYCTEDKNNEVFLSIAGHYDMYQDIFSVPVKDSLSAFDILLLHTKLLSHFPHPESGGAFRQSNAMVLGAKFETIDYHDILPEMVKTDGIVKDFFSRRTQMTMSEYIKHVARIHHRMTTIHPFSDGNGRASRAFMNMQLVRAGMLPVYIKVDEKNEYLEALERIDKHDDYEPLYEIIFKHILRSHTELNKG